MKPTLLFATLSMMCAMPQAFAASELETLRTRCAEQERQIRQLENQLETLKPGSTQRGAAVSKPAPVETAAAAGAVHTVRPGECLEGIARRAGCSAAKLAKANGLKATAVIHPGQKLKLPGASSSPAAAATPPVLAASAPAINEGKTHKVQAGETYASISRKHRVSINSLVAANPEVKPTALRPGQVIRLSAAKPASAPIATHAPEPKSASHVASAPKTHTPAATIQDTPATTTVMATKSPETPAQPVAKSTPPPAPAAAEKPAETAAAAPASQSSQPVPSPNPEKKIRSVTIEGEMTYGEFAATHGTDTSRLNDLNGLDLTNATVLAKGSELYVPAQP